jgi:hypothetical protein
MHRLRPGALPIAARHALRHAAGSCDWAGPESAPANCRTVKTASTKAAGVKTASTKAAGVKTASTKAATSVETNAVEAVVEAVEAVEAVVEAVEAAMETAEAATAAPAATARRHNVGCKQSKCCSRQQRDHDFTEHD